MSPKSERPETTPRELAFDILQRVEQAGAFASVLLDRLETRLRDPRDAALLHELVLGVLRKQSGIDAALGRVSKRPVDAMDAQVRVALRIGAYSILFLDRVPDHAAVSTAVDLTRRGRRASAAGFVNGVLRALARAGRDLLPPEPADGDVPGLAAAEGHPAWWVERVVGDRGWRSARALLQANNRPARTVLRVNRRKSDAQGVIAALSDAGVTAVPGRFMPDALRITEGNPARSEVFSVGLAWAQDEAAQIVPSMLSAPLGPRVADICAAPGSKTLQLAEGLAPGGLLVAIDRRWRRLRGVAGNAGRIGAREALLVAADMSRRPPFRGLFDRMLVDAPCSGTGTLRRNPEIRWRLRREDFKLLAARQSALLETAASLTAPGGQWVYSVCSVEPEEGELLIRDFLSRHPDFRVLDPRPNLPQSCRELIDASGFLRTSPDVGELDGFFAALVGRERTSPGRGA